MHTVTTGFRQLTRNWWGKLVTLGMNNGRGVGGGSVGQVSVLRQIHSWLWLDRTERSTGTAVVCAVVRRRLGWGATRSAVNLGGGGGGGGEELYLFHLG